MTNVSADHRQDDRPSRGPIQLRDTLVQLLGNIDAQEQLRERAIKESIKDAMGETWDRRAQMFEAVGTDAADLIAQNCRNHARLLRGEFDV